MTTKLREALEPCPFCGGAGRHDRYQDYETGRREEGWQVSTVGCPTCDIEFTFWEEDAAIAAWNTRQALASEDHIDEGVERLDPYEVANQLSGYIDMDTPDDLRRFLSAQADAAAQLGDEIAATRQVLGTASDRPTAGEDLTDRFWLIIREPGCVPDRKGPWKHADAAKILREFMAANPTAFIDYLTIGPDGAPDVEHGPEVLQYTDGRSMSVGTRHNKRVLAALSSSQPQPDREEMSPAEVNLMVVVSRMYTAWMRQEVLQSRPDAGFDIMEQMANELDIIRDTVPELNRAMFAALSPEGKQ